jgi:hypothetical protein
MRKRRDRSFVRYYTGVDGLHHVVWMHSSLSACGQNAAAVKIWGGSKMLTCLMCLGSINR